MLEIRIDGFLIQSKLENALRQIVGKDNWIGREIPLPVGRRRWDMGYSIDGRNTVVEFDGDAHYRDTLKIKVDEEKDRIALKHNIRVVRIPYWVQLTTETLSHYFGLSASIQQDFAHGFITTKVFPASFCELGLRRFDREMKSLPEQVRLAVIKSLKDRSLKYGISYVAPAAWQDIVRNSD